MQSFITVELELPRVTSTTAYTQANTCARGYDVIHRADLDDGSTVIFTTVPGAAAPLCAEFYPEGFDPDDTGDFISLRYVVTHSGFLKLAGFRGVPALPVAVRVALEHRGIPVACVSNSPDRD